MSEYGPETYGEHVADVYDDWYRLPDVGPEVAMLHELAVGGRALELGVGTGRVAIPLAATGVEVHGIEASDAMVERLRAKAGGDAVVVHRGDMADVDVDRRFAVVYVVFNTFFQLLTQEAQVRCFRNVAARLGPGGCFVVHVFVPDTSRYLGDNALGVREAGMDRVRLDASTLDPQTQTVHSTQVELSANGTRFVHARLRFAYPPEIDLMAQLAGLHLESRWGSFAREPFTADSAFHVSVYRAPA